jgi:membrane-associated phospholipid phosphatase
MRFFLRLHDAFQNRITAWFFKGGPSPLAGRITYMIENLFLMFVVFFLLLNTLAYDWTGSLYPEGAGFRLDWVFGGLDNSIPFIPEAAAVYVFIFYSFAVLTMAYFGLVAADRGYALSWSLIIIHLIALVVYIVFPVSTHWYRAGLLAHPLRNNFWAQVMYSYYASDTSFNCFPSLHAAVSAAAAYTWYRYYRLKASLVRFVLAAAAIIIALAVVLSTLFVRQHYIADEAAGVLLALVTARYVFKRLWKPPTVPG